jgi:hypothetical protein
MILKTVEYDTNPKTSITWNVEIVHKIKKWTTQLHKVVRDLKILKVYESGHFQNNCNFLIFLSANEYDVNNVCAKFKYLSPQVCTTGFTSHLNLHHQRVCGNIPQPLGQAYSSVNRHRVVRGRQFYTLQFTTRCLNFNTDASQPASATAAPSPIGSRSGQPKWDKIRASAGQSQSTSTTPLSTRERYTSSSVPPRPAERPDRQYHQQAPPSAGVHHGTSPHWRGQQLYAP